MVIYLSQITFQNEEKDQLEQLFEAIDKNGDGYIQRSELTEIYTQLYGDSQIAKIEANALFNAVNLNHDDTIDFSEYLMANVERCKITQQSYLRSAFNNFDTDKNGVITLDELESIFYIPFKNSEKKSKVNEMFTHADANKDMKISFEEFVKMMESIA